MVVRGQPGQKVHKTPSPSIKKLSMVVHTCHSSYAGGINSMMSVQAGPGINIRPYSKDNNRPYSKDKAKRAGDVAEVVQHLPSKHKALCHQKREKGSKKE
jgi:hypothetical protein